MLPCWPLSFLGLQGAGGRENGTAGRALERLGDQADGLFDYSPEP